MPRLIECRIDPLAENGVHPPDHGLAALDYVPVGLFVLRHDLSVVFWNACLEEWTGIDRRTVLGTSIGAHLPHLNDPKYTDRLKPIFEGGPPIIFSSQLHKHLIRSPSRNDQTWAHHTIVTPVRAPDGEGFYALVSIQDVTDLTNRVQDYRRMRDQAIEEIQERRRAEATLHTREKQQAVASTVGGLLLETGDLTSVMNRSVTMIAETLAVELCEVLLLDETSDSLRLIAGVGWKDDSVGHATASTSSDSQVGHTLITNGPVIVSDWNREDRFHRRPLLDFHDVRSGITVPMVSRGRTIGVLGAHSQTLRTFTSEDITFFQSIARLIAVGIERKRAEESLAQQSIRDTLTNLYNRRHFSERLAQEIARAKRTPERFAVLLCDLDRFKNVNDTHGHHIGDRVLEAVAESIKHSTRGSDLVFRWGGDEIVLILSRVTPSGITIAAERIRQGVRRVGEQMNVDFDISIGVALYPDHGDNEEELIRLADRALYIAKKGGYKVYIGAEEYHVDEHSIRLVYQPVVDVLTQQTLGYEALCRDPQGRLSVPELFRKYHAIGQLSELKRICFLSQLKTAHEANIPRVFINIDFELLGLIGPVPKPPGMDVILEISELEALDDLERRLSTAVEWRTHGYKFAIDDFGAGFISLPFIARLVPEYLKIDRSTVLQAVASPTFESFLKSLLGALQNYVKEGIIAEGIELDKELQVVKQLGIFKVQGYLLGRPDELKSARLTDLPRAS